jgi:hypothetical protein
MATTWKQTSTVGEGGRVEVVVPELRLGESVIVLVEQNAGSSSEATIPAGKRKMGFFKGKIWMADDFDAPLDDDFSEYM